MASSLRTRIVSSGAATALVAAMLVVAAPVVANADPIVPSLSGTVSLDTDANGAVGASTAAGTEEAGFAAATVDVVCVATGAVIASTTPAADGTWSFVDLDLDADPDVVEPGDCADGVVVVEVTVTDDRYSITDAAGENQTPRAGDEQFGRSAPITLTDASDEVVNTLVRPDWYLNLTIPIDAATNADAVYTGSDPFDSTCPQAGNDCSASDTTVRSADTVTFTWAVTGSSLDDLSPSLSAVILEQTLELHDGALANFARIPARCKPAGGGGAVPASVIVDQNGTVIPEGAMAPAGTTSVTLRCNLGDWTQTGDAVSLQPVVKTSAESPNGSSFTTTARAYAVDPAGAPTAVPSDSTAFGPVDITSAPAYELEKKGFFNQDPTVRTIDGVATPGWYTYAVIQIKTNKRVGVEALQNPITITEDVVAFHGDGVTPYPDFEYYITQCIPNPSQWSGTVGGKTAPYSDFLLEERTVVDSGTCAFARDDASDLTSDYTLTFDDIDMSGVRYPTRNASNADLSAGPFYVASYRVQVFIPYDSLDADNGVLGDETGGLTLYNRVGGFDPLGVSGTSNFGDGREPGYCEPVSADGFPLDSAGMPNCDPSGTNTGTPGKSDNVVGPTSFVMAPGYFAKYLLNQTTLYSSSWSPLPGMTNAHDGQAVLQPGQIVDTHMNWRNGASLAWTNSQMCDVFDNTMAVLVPSSATVVGGTDSIYAWLSPDGAPQNAAYNAKWIFEFGRIDLPDGDDPLSGGISPTTGRYVGTWTNQAAARCDDDAATGGWFTDPNQVPGGIDAVNAVRVRPGIDPDTQQPTTQGFGVNNRLNFGMRIRDAFYGGPHDGEFIPAGAVFANFGSARADQTRGGAWLTRSYIPSPENTSVDGDRVTIARATLAIQKRTITVDGVGDGAADFGTTGNAVAGNPIVWEIVSSVLAESDEPAPVQQLTITDVLPAFVDYDQDCTATIAGGTPADIVQYDTPAAGQTTLVWNLGTWTPNTDVPNRRICTVSDPLAPQGTSLVNRADITYLGSPVKPFDLHTVTLEQTGELKLRKTVDAPLDVLNDGQDYTLSIQNFSATLTVGAPTIIEVFPYNGDANPPGGVNRSPASAYHGDLVLTGPATVTNISGGAYSGTVLYTTDAPATINQNLNANTSTWVTEASLGGDFSQVTGIKFVGDDDLTPIGSVATSGATVAFTLQAGDTADPFSAAANEAGDLYSNRFAAFSSTFMGANGFQVLASNRVTVRTVSHSNGDLVFEDRDGDGRYTAGRDLLVPDGTVVNLWYEGANGDVLVDTTTTTDGVYLFTKLPPGTYHVEIPASQFTGSGPLVGYSLTVAPSAGAGEAAVNQNDDVSHDAIAGTGGAIVSNSFTLSSTVNPTTKSVSGDEPTAENIHGVDDPSTTDPFSNLAIDLALQRAPGLDIEKEVCTLADNDCDPEAAIGAGGWSVDGVPGVGPVSETVQRPYGSAVLWRIVVTNTGQQYLTDVEVTDPVTPACAADDGDQPAFADLAPGQVVSYTCQTASITANITPNTATVVGTPNGSQNTLTDVDTANATTTGSLRINKTLEGAGVAEFGDGPFTFRVECTNGLTETVVLTPTEGQAAITSEPITGLPLGTSCTVTETDSAGADTTPAPVTVLIVANDQRNTVVAGLTNRFSAGTLSVLKQLDGTAVEGDFAEYLAGLEFEIQVTCEIVSESGDGEDLVETLWSGLVTIVGGQTVDIVGEDDAPVLLPLGTHCYGEETDDGGATEAVVDHDSYENAAIVTSAVEPQALTITASNTFDEAEIVVTKRVIGPGTGTFRFAVECTLDGEPFPLAEEDAEFLLSAGQSRTIRVLVGTECAVTEVDPPASAVVELLDTDATTAGGTTDGIVVAGEQRQEVTVTNVFPLASTGSTTSGGAGLAPIAIGAGGVAALGLLGILGAAWASRRRRHAAA